MRTITHPSITFFGFAFIKVFTTLFILFVFSQKLNSQTILNPIYPQIQKSTLNHLAASNVSLSSGIRILQSVGQSGVIGSSSTSNNTVQQGYLNNHLQFRVNNDISDEFEKSFKFSIYPNPFQDFINIQFTKTTLFPVLVRVFDMRGRMVHDEEFRPAKDIRLHVGHFEEAGYVIRIASGGKSYLKKLIKSNN